ncbi:MAG: HK97 gp10 family phage protein [Phycisphaerales bacterium]|nr:HK97 gp10 family phage protein [Phycisphaerales bacterium]
MTKTTTYAELPLGEMQEMLRRLKDQAEPIREGTLRLAAEALVSEAQMAAPVDTGLLKSAHLVIQVTDQEALIGTNTKYALAVHETHPTNKRWFVNAIVTNFQRVFEGALKITLARAGREAAQ